MTNPRFHGITSLLLIMSAAILGLVVITQNSWVWGAIFLALMLGTPQILLRTFCAKCPCKTRCGHVLPGKAAMAFAKRSGAYTPAELLALVGVMVLLFGMPQFWLWQKPVLFIAYWMLVGISVTQIRLALCPACNNVFCPLRVKARA